MNVKTTKFTVEKGEFIVDEKICKTVKDFGMITCAKRFSGVPVEHRCLLTYHGKMRKNYIRDYKEMISQRVGTASGGKISPKFSIEVDTDTYIVVYWF